MPSVVEKKCYGSVEVYWLNRDEAVRRIAAAAASLVEQRGDVLAVYIFGSLATGRAVPGSDADILVLLKRSHTRRMDRPLEFTRYFDTVGLPVDLFCYTTEETEHHPFAREAMHRGFRVAGNRPGTTTKLPRSG